MQETPAATLQWQLQICHRFTLRSVSIIQTIPRCRDRNIAPVSDARAGAHRRLSVVVMAITSIGPRLRARPWRWSSRASSGVFVAKDAVLDVGDCETVGDFQNHVMEFVVHLAGLHPHSLADL